MAEKVVGFRIRIKGSDELIKSQKQLNEILKQQKRHLQDLEIGSKEYKEQKNIVAQLVHKKREINKELLNQAKSYDAVKKGVGAYRQLSQQLINARNKTKNLAAENKENTDEYRKAIKEVKELDRRLKKIDASVGQFSRSVGNYKGALSGFNGLLGKLGLAVGVTELTGAASEGINIYREFDNQIKILGAVSGSTAKELERLRNQAKEVGSTTQFTASQIAGLQTALARLGFSSQEILNSTQPISDLAIATGEDIEASAKVIGQAIKAYGLEASDAGRVSDLLTNSFNTSALQLETFAEASKEIAPTARLLGVSIEETTAAMGLLADNGLEGTVATTTLQSALQRLADPTKKYQKAANQLGVEIFDQQGKFVGLANLIRNVNEVTKDMTDQQRQSAVSQIFGIQAAKNFGVLLQGNKTIIQDNNEVTLQGADAIEAYTKQLENSNGVAADTARQIEDSLQGDFLKLRSAIEGAAIELVEMNEGGLRGFVQVLTEAVPILQQNAGFLLRLATLFGVLIARQKLLTALKKEDSKATILLNALNKAYAVTMGLLNASTRQATLAQIRMNAALIANPIGIIITLVGGLVLGLIELYNRSETARRVMDALFEVFDSIGYVIAQVAKGLFSLSKRWFSFVGGVLSKVPFLAKAINFIKNTFENFDISNFFNGFIAGLKGLTAAFRQVGDNVKAFFNNLVLDAAIKFKELQLKIKEALGFDTTKLKVEIDELEARKAANNAKKSGKSIGDAFKGAYKESMEGSKAVSKKVAKEINQDVGAEFLDLANKTDDLTDANDKLSKSYKSVQKTVETAAKGSIKQLRKAISDIKSDLEATNDDTKMREYTRQLVDLEKQLKVAEDKIKNSRLQFEEKTTSLENGKEFKAESDDRLSKELLLQNQLNQVNKENEDKRLQDRVDSLNEWFSQNEETVNQIEAVNRGLSAVNQSIMNRQLAAAGDNEEKRREIQQKAAKRQKVLSIGEALINTYKAAANALSQFPYPANLIIAGLNTAAGLIQVDAIRKTPVFAKGGIIQGNSHANGGVPIEAEGGEIIINKKSSALFKGELSEINSYNGFGKKFAKGGIVNPISPTPILPSQLVANQKQQQNNLQQRQLELIQEQNEVTNKRIDNIKVIMKKGEIIEALTNDETEPKNTLF